MPQPESTPDFIRLQREFCSYLRDPEQHAPPAEIEDRRLAIYRHAIFSNVEGLLKDNYPRVKAVLSDEDWQRLVRHYIIHHESLASAFVDVPEEFLHYLDSSNVFAGLPGFVRELAHFDWLETLVGADIREIDDVSAERGDDLLSAIPVVNPLLRIVVYQYPVHAISQEYRPQEPPPQPTYIAAFRDRSNRYGFLDINALTARLLELMQANKTETGGALFGRLADEFSFQDTEALINAAQPILSRMLERDVILGIQERPR